MMNINSVPVHVAPPIELISLAVDRLVDAIEDFGPELQLDDYERLDCLRADFRHVLAGLKLCEDLDHEENARLIRRECRLLSFLVASVLSPLALHMSCDDRKDWEAATVAAFRQLVRYRTLIVQVAEDLQRIRQESQAEPYDPAQALEWWEEHMQTLGAEQTPAPFIRAHNTLEEHVMHSPPANSAQAPIEEKITASPIDLAITGLSNLSSLFNDFPHHGQATWVYCFEHVQRYRERLGQIRQHLNIKLAEISPTHWAAFRRIVTTLDLVSQRFTRGVLPFASERLSDSDAASVREAITLLADERGNVDRVLIDLDTERIKSHARKTQDFFARVTLLLEAIPREDRASVKAKHPAIPTLQEQQPVAATPSGQTAIHAASVNEYPAITQSPIVAPAPKADVGRNADPKTLDKVCDDELTRQVIAVFEKHPTEAMSSKIIGLRTDASYKAPTVRKVLPKLKQRGVIQKVGRKYRKAVPARSSGALAS